MNISDGPSLYKRLCAFLRITYTCGKDRIVLAIGFLGIVIKFPKTKLGNRVNFGEWYFWKKTQHVFCQPTFFCFGLYGLSQKKRYWITIQKLGYRSCESDPEEFAIKCSILTRRATETDSHHFHTPTNFFFDKNKKLVMIDYGSRQTRRIIKSYGTKIHKDFDENIRCTFDDLVKLIDTLDSIRVDHQH